MGKLIILGLGPGAPDLLTREALDVLNGASDVYLRTARHPAVSSLPPHLQLHSFDDLYNSSKSFSSVYQQIADQIVALAGRPEGVIYAVPGHPLVAEESVRLIIGQAGAIGLRPRVVAGLSFIEPACVALGIDPVAASLQLVDATRFATLFADGPSGQLDPFAGSLRLFDPTRPALIAQLYGIRLAVAVKLVLLEFLPPDHPVVLLSHVGLPEEKAQQVALFELDRQSEPDHLTLLYVPARAVLDDRRSFSTLQHIVARLRAPGGCPWDREQTHATIKADLLEEAYEAVDALDRGDLARFAEELGDCLLQVVLHAQLAIEADEFGVEGVLESINAKLIRRHPHVFGDVVATDSDQVLQNWDRIKRTEKTAHPSPLASIPVALPALARAAAVQRRAERAGWKAPAAENGGATALAMSPEERRDEVGAALFAQVTAARRAGVDPEEALRLRVSRFIEEREAEATGAGPAPSPA